MRQRAFCPRGMTSLESVMVTKATKAICALSAKRASGEDKVSAHV